MVVEKWNIDWELPMFDVRKTSVGCGFNYQISAISHDDK